MKQTELLMHTVDLCGDWKFGWSDSCFDVSGAEDLSINSIEVFDCTVPGNFELDLEKIDKVSDPFFGMNPVEINKFAETKYVYYTRYFNVPDVPGDPVLVFEGIDCFADIFLNNEKVGSVGNMLVEHEIDVSGYIKPGMNELFIHIRPAVFEAEKYEYNQLLMSNGENYEALFIRKPPHMFGWDIMPRFVSAGLYRHCRLEFRAEERIEECYLKTIDISPDKTEAYEYMFYDLKLLRGERYAIRVSGRCGNSEFSEERLVFFKAGTMSFTVEKPKLWYTNNRGDANLYEVTFSLLKNGVEIDRREFNHGIRTVELHRTSVTTSLGEGEFVFLINGEKVFIKGTNHVPADAFHSRDKERLPKIMELADDLNINMIRCWGGNVYEDKLFYDECDRRGMLVWQDFTMACAIYPQDEEFQKVMYDETVKVVKRLRQHPCVALWAGDNECDQLSRMWLRNKIDPNDNIITRKILPEAIRIHDGSRPYIASSPFVDDVAAKYDDAYHTEYHLWGPRDYYKSLFYINSLCHFVSEIGYHGCPSVESVKKFISADKLWPCLDNEEWILHCTSPIPEAHTYDYRVKLMLDQINETFSESPDNLEEFSLASQIVQGEAKKFFIELFRTHKWRRTGILWWNLADGWPQFSDAVVDYYFVKKLAYYYIKNSQQHVCIMLKEPSDWVQKVVVSNDTPIDADISVKIRDIDTDEIVYSREVTAPADSTTEIGDIRFLRSKQRFFVIEWTGEHSGKNHYLAGNPPFDLETYRNWLKKSDLFSEYFSVY